MKILITGAFGFVGTNLSAFLKARGHHLLAIDVAGQAGAAYSEFYTWDELERVDWSRVDAVVHLAGKAHDTRNASDPKSYFEVNVGLTKKVLESAVGSWQSAIGKGDGCRQDVKTTKKFVLFSSVKAVADRADGVLTEEAVPNPQTPYGQSKLEAEGEVLKCGGRSSKVLKCESSKVRECGSAGAVLKCESSRVLECGSASVPEVGTTVNGANQENSGNFRTSELPNFRTYILRPCMIHGPGNKGNLNLLYGIVRKGIPWPLGAFENRRSFASVENVCAVVEGLLAGAAPSGIYQVADDEALSTNQVIGLISDALGRRARIWRISETLVRMAARAGDLLRLPLNSERLKKLTESYVVSNDKIKRALGWERMPVRAEIGMRKTLESLVK